MYLCMYGYRWSQRQEADDGTLWAEGQQKTMVAKEDLR